MTNIKNRGYKYLVYCNYCGNLIARLKFFEMKGIILKCGKCKKIVDADNPNELKIIKA